MPDWHDWVDWVHPCTNKGAKVVVNLTTCWPHLRDLDISVVGVPLVLVPRTSGTLRRLGSSLVRLKIDLLDGDAIKDVPTLVKNNPRLESVDLTFVTLMRVNLAHASRLPYLKVSFIFRQTKNENI